MADVAYRVGRSCALYPISLSHSPSDGFQADAQEWGLWVVSLCPLVLWGCQVSLQNGVWWVGFRGTDSVKLQHSSSVPHPLPSSLQTTHTAAKSLGRISGPALAAP